MLSVSLETPARSQLSFMAFDQITNISELLEALKSDELDVAFVDSKYVAFALNPSKSHARSRLGLR